jgi:hypothetical protein
LHLRIKLSAIKLLDHIVNSPNTLVNKIYINTEKTNKWVTTIKEWINKLGIGHLNFNTNNSKFYTISIQQRIQDQAKQNMNSLINVCEKFFWEIHKSGERTICKLKSDRSLLSKFRLSAHSLAIEKGRYSNIERQNRVCLSCDTGEVENEYHFFSTCPHYRYISLRKTFLQKVNIKIVNSNISLRHMSLLFNSSLQVTLKITVNFLNDCFLMRKAI